MITPTKFHRKLFKGNILVERQKSRTFFIWPGFDKPLDITKALNYKQSAKIPYDLKLIINEEQNEVYHLRRIRYFIENPDKIDAIKLEANRASLFSVNYHTTDSYLRDGHHRMAAAILGEHESIPATYRGMEYTWNWLSGNITDEEFEAMQWEQTDFYGPHIWGSDRWEEIKENRKRKCLQSF